MEFLFQTQLKTRAAYILNCLCYCSYGDCNLSFCFYFWVKPIPFCLLHVCAVLHVGYCQDLGGRRAATSSSPCLEIQGRFSFFPSLYVSVSYSSAHSLQHWLHSSVAFSGNIPGKHLQIWLREGLFWKVGSIILSLT